MTFRFFGEVTIMKTHKILLLCGAVAVSACSGSTVKDTLGIERKSPDEFRVVSRPPLYIPPQFNLRPPEAGAQSPIIVPADKQAKSLLLEGNSESTSAAAGQTVKGITSGEQKFLQNIGADKANPQVRSDLTQQAIVKQEQKEEASWWDSIVGVSQEKKEPLVDARKEVERIKTNEKTGKPVTEGATPEVKSGDRGCFREWLGM